MFRGREVYHPELGEADLGPDRRARWRGRQDRGRAKPRQPQHDDGARARQAGPPGPQATAANQQRAERNGAGPHREPPGNGAPEPRRTAEPEATGGGRGQPEAAASAEEGYVMPKMKTDRERPPSASGDGNGRLRVARRIVSPAREHHVQRASSCAAVTGSTSPRATVGVSAACSDSESLTPGYRHPPAPPRDTSKGAPMAEFKHASTAEAPPSVTRRCRPRATTATSQSDIPVGQRAAHALPAVRVPGPTGTQGRLPPAVDPADQCRWHVMSYSRLITGLHRAGVDVDRKVLRPHLAVSDDAAFGALVQTAQDDSLRHRRPRSLPDPAAGLHDSRVRRLRGLLQEAKQYDEWSRNPTSIAAEEEFRATAVVRSDSVLI